MTVHNIVGNKFNRIKVSKAQGCSDSLERIEVFVVHNLIYFCIVRAMLFCSLKMSLFPIISRIIVLIIGGIKLLVTFVAT